MLAALLMVATLSDWVPARWPSNDPATLDLIAGGPINCLLIDQKHWSGAFAANAAAQNIAVVGLIQPGGNVMQSIRTAKEQALAAVALEGDFPAAEADAARQTAASLQLHFIELPSRRGIRFDSGAKILGTSQGVWPGIQAVDEKDKAHAMPSGGPWIDTNTGFLRYARAMQQEEFWVGVIPPENQVLPVDRYLQAIADAAMVGARWIVALDGNFSRRLLVREAAAVRDWKRIAVHLNFYEELKPYRKLPPFAQMAVVQDAASGALLSGSVLDMIAVKHTPVRPVPGARLSLPALDKATMAVNVDPQSLTAEQREVLKNFTRAGGTVLNGPPGWRMPSASRNQITMDKDDVEKLDQIWKEMNGMINRRNLGVRLFNVSSMVSFLQATPDAKRAVLHLVNYSGYPVESVTAHVLGRYKKAWMLTPEGGRKALEPYDVEEGAATGFDIDTVPVAAVLVMER
ncbi:MAG TPA: hypothetical protein VM120_28050 [Bryobacteraceae bacterium]|nr:hypothetical protein [Bryobacteraceae bacterium]